MAWVKRTGRIIMSAARALAGDLDVNKYVVHQTTLAALYRVHAMSLAREIGWNGERVLTLALAAGDTTKNYPTSLVEVLNITSPVWNRTGIKLDRRPPEEIRAAYAIDTATAGAVRRGDPELWSFEVTEPGAGVASTQTLMFYPAPAIAGSVIFNALEWERLLDNENEYLLFGEAMTYLLKLRLAIAILSRMSPDDMTRCGVSPNTTIDLQQQYNTMFAQEKASATANYRQRAVMMTRSS